MNEDLTGRKFARLTVLHLASPGTKHKHEKWACSCECGGRCDVTSSNLRSGNTKSCGCLHKQTVAELLRRSKTQHGHAKRAAITGTWKSWSSMVRRCTDSNIRDFHRYGGRGIKVCERWLKFENFLADMGERPDGMSIDRYPDNDGNYEPGNCRWATKAQQDRNQRRNLSVSIGGVTRLVSEWSELSGINGRTLYKRYHKGITGEAFLAPPRGRVPAHASNESQNRRTA